VGTKQAVKKVLDQLPEDCSMEEVLYHLYVVDAAQRGVAETDAGKGIPHAQVVAELRRKRQLDEEK
jgi:predicted transcriptional regulator